MIKAIKRHLFEWDGKGPDWATRFLAGLPFIVHWTLQLCGVMP